MPRDLSFREERFSVEEETGWDKARQVNGLVFMDSAHCDPTHTSSVLASHPGRSLPPQRGRLGEDEGEMKNSLIRVTSPHLLFPRQTLKRVWGKLIRQGLALLHLALAFSGV